MGLLQSNLRLLVLLPPLDLLVLARLSGLDHRRFRLGRSGLSDRFRLLDRLGQERSMPHPCFRSGLLGLSHQLGLSDPQQLKPLPSALLVLSDQNRL